MTLGTIVYVGGFELPDRNAAAHRVVNNAKILEKIGYTLLLCGVKKAKNVKKEIIDISSERKEYVRKYPNSFIDWLILEMNIDYLKIAKEKYSDLRGIVMYNPHILSLFRTIVFCKKNKIRVLIDVTEWYEHKFSLKPIKFIKWCDTNISMKILYKKVDGMIVISNYLKNYYQKRIRNIAIIPPLIDISDDKWNDENAQDIEKVVFVYSGVPEKDKDRLDLIIDAFANVKKDFLFVIVGISEEEFYDLYPEYKEKINGMNGKIDFKGKLSHKESVKVIKHSDYGIIVRNKSIKNNAGFPTKFVEYLTCGIGIISNKTSDIELYYPMENSIILNSIETNCICDAINASINNGKIIKKTSNIFDYNLYVDKLEKVFNDTLRY